MKKTIKIMGKEYIIPEKGDKASTREAYGLALFKLGEKNKNIVALDADLSCSTQTAIFSKLFENNSELCLKNREACEKLRETCEKDREALIDKKRFFNMGVAEQDMIGTAAGLAISGKIPFASTFAIFATGRAWEQIRQSVCYSNLNVNIVATHGGITVGEDGATHHAVEDLALMRVLPNMTVIVPSDYHEVTQVINTAVSHDGPCYIRLSRPNTLVINEEKTPFSLGKARTLREGKDVTLIGIGLMVAVCLEAADFLAKEGISARVINMSTLKPLDTDTVISAAKDTGAIVTAEEHSIIGGLGSAVAETLSTQFPVPLKIVGVSDKFGTSGKPDLLLKEYGLTSQDIKDAALAAIRNKDTLSSSTGKEVYSQQVI